MGVFTKEVGGILVEVGASEWLVVAESPFVPSGGRKCREGGRFNKGSGRNLGGSERFGVASGRGGSACNLR
ncbi:hypothetical protein Q73_12925 [Bacillus coahuilensis m2-6]|nr:hypothetical protein Q73_12925 [Bacillus coahuilensis m2-6]